MAKAKVYTRYYRAFENVPDEVIPELRKLNIGDWGVMRGLVPCLGEVKNVLFTEYRDGMYHPVYRDVCYDCYGDDASHAKQWTDTRHIVVAYNDETDKAVGWAVKDTVGAVNLFVAKKYRKQGIAKKLALRYIARDKGKQVKVYNGMARDAVVKAVARSKFKKRVRMWGG